MANQKMIFPISTTAIGSALQVYTEAIGGISWATAAVTLENKRYGVLPCSITFKKMAVTCSAAPGAGRTRTYTLNINGVGTALTVTLSGAVQTTASILVDVATIATDQISLTSTQTGGASSPSCQISIQFEMPAASNSILVGRFDNTGFQVSRTLFFGLHFVQDVGAGLGPAEDNCQTLWMPTGGTLKNLYVRTGLGPGVGKNHTFTVRKNGVDTALTLNNTGVAAMNANIAADVAFVQNDQIRMKILCDAGSSDPLYETWGILWVPTIPSENILCVSNISGNTGAVTYCHSNASYQTPDDVTGRDLTYKCTIKKLTAAVTAAGGVGKGWTWRVRCPTGDSGIIVTLTNVTGPLNDNVNTKGYVDGDFINVSISPFGPPAAANWAYSMVQLISDAAKPSGANIAAKLAAAGLI